MIYLIDKQTLLEEAIHRHISNSSSNSNNSSEQNIKNTEKLFNELNIFLKKYNIPKDQIIIFGSAVLGLKGLRTPNDLDIGITENGISTIKNIIVQLKVHMELNMILVIYHLYMN